MQIHGNSAAYELNPLKRVLGTLFQQPANSAGQNSPTDASSSTSAASPLPLPAPGQQFASATLASLLGVQQQAQTPTAADIANQVIGKVDTDGDGQLSASEITTALNAGGDNRASDAVTAAISKLDSNGDGQLSADELTAAIQQRMTQVQGHHHHHHGGHGGPSGADLASKIIGAGDTDGDGSLSQNELSGELGQAGVTMSSDDLATAFKKLDGNGDGLLSGAELAAAIDALRGGSPTPATADSSTTPTVAATDPNTTPTPA
jgi:Ca2+-binding EF-hand superfamily protein